MFSLIVRIIYQNVRQDADILCSTNMNKFQHILSVGKNMSKIYFAELLQLHQLWFSFEMTSYFGNHTSCRLSAAFLIAHSVLCSLTFFLGFSGILFMNAEHQHWSRGT